MVDPTTEHQAGTALNPPGPRPGRARTSPANPRRGCSSALTLCLAPLLVAGVVGCSGTERHVAVTAAAAAEPTAAEPTAADPTTADATTADPAAVGNERTPPPPDVEPAASSPVPVTEPVASDVSNGAPSPSTETTTARTVTDPLDDLDEDGEFDARCGTVDLGGELVVERLCSDALRPEPESGVVPTPDSVLWLPAPPRWDDLVAVDATVRVATRPTGQRVVIYVLGTDALFGKGSSDLQPTAAPPLEAISRSINLRVPGLPITVRGGADSVGSAASNESLSKQRADAVAAALAGFGLDPALVAAVGLGSAVPAAEELLPDGSVSEPGRQANRRVEIVVG